MSEWYDTIVASLKNAIEAVFEQKSNKVTSISSSSTDTQYPSAKCVYDAIGGGGGVVVVDNLTTDDGTKALSARQGKVLNELIGDAITYINQ